MLQRELPVKTFEELRFVNTIFKIAAPSVHSTFRSCEKTFPLV
jgi:hypothetical protein